MTPTTMRDAFENATVTRAARNKPLVATCLRSLKRGVGLTERRQFWSIGRRAKR